MKILLFAMCAVISMAQFSASSALIPKSLLKPYKITELEIKLLRYNIHDLATMPGDVTGFTLSGLSYNEKENKIKAFYSIEDKFADFDMEQKIAFLKLRVHGLYLALTTSIGNEITINDLLAVFVHIDEDGMTEINFENGVFEYVVSDRSIGKIIESKRFDY